jgi:hypothetical protein
MNTTIDVHKEFVKNMECKIPKKTKLADFISDTLRIEKESAYRRLRGEVQFTFKEAALIAIKMNLSLNEIILNASPGNKTKNVLELPVFHSDATNFGDEPTDRLIEDAIIFLKALTQQAFSEFGLALSGILFPLFLNYTCLSRFYILKHLHNNSSQLTNISFEKIAETKKQIEEREEFYLLYRQISHTFYIWDKKIIPALVEDIRYFQAIHLIKENEVGELKADIHRFLSDLEQLAIDGKFKETGNKFDLFISELGIDLSYAYIGSEKISIALFSTFIFFTSASQEKNLVKKVSDWVNSLKRCSVLISDNAAKERILFFDKQRAIVNTL